MMNITLCPSKVMEYEYSYDNGWHFGYNNKWNEHILVWKCDFHVPHNNHSINIMFPTRDVVHSYNCLRLYFIIIIFSIIIIIMVTTTITNGVHIYFNLWYFHLEMSYETSSKIKPPTNCILQFGILHLN